ncbi:MAG: HAMP domain-containing histidine kinase [Bacteroidetes bacterium]|nr:HAMP domain-containing histidine kinase [Bacteroidota bacterium]
MNQHVTTDPSSYYGLSHNATNLPMMKARELTASVAHDLKNPLQTIAWLAEFLRTKNSTFNLQEQEESLSKIIHCTREMDKLIANLMVNTPSIDESNQLISEPQINKRINFSDLSEQSPAVAAHSNGINFNSNTTDLENLLFSIQQVFPKTMSPEIALDTRTKMIPIDESILHRIFHNLISNSIKHGNPYKCLITVKAEVTSNRAEITYLDNGPGLPEKSWNILLQPSQKEIEHVHQPQNRLSGNGLFNIRNLVIKNGGTIGAESEKGPSAIKLIFPLNDQVRNSSHIPPWL